jgi:PAS domain-containing protein
MKASKQEGRTKRRRKQRAPPQPALPRDLEALLAEKDRLLAEKDRMLAHTEQRSLALGESEKRYRQLVDAASDWFWENDADGRFTYISPNVEAVLGLPASAISASVLPRPRA